MWMLSDPYIFYHRVRIYFSGWSNMPDLPNGLLYESDTGEIERMFEAEKTGIPVEDKVYPLCGAQKYPGGNLIILF